MAEPLAALFDRVRVEPDARLAPPLADVHRSAAGIRPRRRVLSVTGSLVATVALVAGVGALRDARSDAGRAATITPAAAAGRSVDGLLLPPDLGAGGWTSSTREDAAVTDATVPTCSAGPLQLAVEGRSRMFRGSTPEHAEWLVGETLTRVRPADAAVVSHSLRQAAACPGPARDLVLAASDTMLITGVLDPSGAVGEAAGYALADGYLVHLQTLPGGAIGGIPLPGQTQWLIGVITTAVERATGVRPDPPGATLAALTAARHYAPPRHVTVVVTPDPDDPMNRDVPLPPSLASPPPQLPPAPPPSP